MLLLILLFTANSTLWAKGACPDAASRELARVSAAPGVVLLACGTATPLVRDLTIYRLKGTAERDRLLDGDAAMKAYRLKRAGRGFTVEEGVAPMGGSFHPFIQVRVACEGDQCAARDTKCLWKKTASPAAAASGTAAPGTWTDKFVSALNGDGEMQAQFQTPNTEAEHSEAFSTYRADLLRLKALGCVR